MSGPLGFQEEMDEGVRWRGEEAAGSQRDQVLVGESLVRGMETAFRGYFPPTKYRSADDGRSLRGFVVTLMYNDDGLANFAEGGEEEMARLNGALSALDTFRTESGHYSWADFVALLAGELGDRELGELGGARGAFYEQGRGFVVPGNDYGKSLLEQTEPYFKQAKRAIDNIGQQAPVGGTREEYLQRLHMLQPGEYKYDSSTGRARKRTAPSDDDDDDHDGDVAPRRLGEAPGAEKAMDVDDHVLGVGVAAPTVPAAEMGEGAATATAAEVEEGEGEDFLSLKDKEIAAIEEQLAALKMETGAPNPASTAAPPPELQQQQQQQQAPIPTLQQTSRWQSATQVSDDVERRIALKASQPRLPSPPPPAPEDDFLRKGPLSAEQERQVDHAFNGGPDFEVLVKAFNTDVTRRDLRCLRPETWLNDEVVNMYMQLLQARDKELCQANPNRRPSHFFNSFFLTKLRGHDSCSYNYRGVRRWTRRVKVFELDKIFVPVNVSNSHWCMAVIYVQQKRINYYDSMGGSGKGVTESLLLWLEDEDEDKNGDNATFEPDDWTRVGTDVAITPQQENGSDCGAFAVSFASYISDDLPFDFRQDDITQMRRRMMWSLLNQHLV